MKFLSEAQMSKNFRETFQSFPIPGNISWIDEFQGGFGIPDYVVMKQDHSRISYVVTFELKLRDWRQGLLQAFRYKNFSNESFLVIDRASIRPALKQLDSFRSHNIGLASYNVMGDFEIHNYPTPSLPFSLRSSEYAAQKLIERSDDLNSEFTSRPSTVFARTTLGRFVVPAIISLHSNPSPCRCLRREGFFA